MSVLPKKLIYKMCSILEAVEEGLMLIGGAELTTEVPDGIVIIQGQAAQEVIQFCESASDLRGVGLMRFCIGLVELI